MNELLLGHEIGIRLGFFFGVFALMAFWEQVAPRRALSASRTARWLSNLGIAALNSVLLRLLFPAAAAGFALAGEERGWGLLNAVPIPAWMSLLAAFVALDLAIYLQHVMFHAVPTLWRLHRMHHADLDFDVTTGGRFHPIEILLSMLIKLGVIAAFGAPALAVLVFEVVLNAASMFNHGNVRLPQRLDRVLRLFVVTPDMHRVHHSVEDDETNSNFGFCLSWWDRLLGTYRDQPRAGHGAMTIGIRTFREPRLCSRLPGMLAIPFIRPLHPPPSSAPFIRPLHPPPSSAPFIRPLHPQGIGLRHQPR